MPRRQAPPKRYEIRTAILNLLAEKKYQPGDKIPTEPELMELLDVSRSSLREGLQMLEQDRLIRTRHGSGRYLSLPTADYHFDISRLQGVKDMMQLYGIEVYTRVISLQEIPATDAVAEALEIPPGAIVVWLERVRMAGSSPVIYSIDIFPRAVVSGELILSEFEGSLLQFLETNYKVYIDHSRTTIKAVTSRHGIPQEVCNNPNEPWILMEQINYDHTNVPIIFSKDYHRGESVAFYITRHRY